MTLLQHDDKLYSSIRLTANEYELYTYHNTPYWGGARTKYITPNREWPRVVIGGNF